MMNRFRGLERAILSLNAPSSRIGRGKETRFFPFATGFVLGIGGVSCLAFAEENKSGTEDKDSGSWVDQTWNSVIGYGSKISKDILGLQKGVTEPLMNKFLPDPIPDSFGRVPRTVVLDFEGTLVNLDWNREEGWRITKRPGADLFIRTLARAGYEIVLFSENPESIVAQVMFAFDPSGVVSYRLFKEHITWKDGMFIKDLSKLNRDLSRVIMIDDNAEGFSMNQDNGVLISTWDKSPKDQALMEALPLLIDIQRNDVQDTREVIRGLGGGNVARKYLESFKEKNEKESKAPEKAPSKSLLGKFSR